MADEEIENMKEFAHNVNEDKFVGDKYNVVANRMKESHVLRENIKGKYRAMRVKDRVEEEFGHIGVTFSVEEA